MIDIYILLFFSLPGNTKSGERCFENKYTFLLIYLTEYTVRLHILVFDQNPTVDWYLFVYQVLKPTEAYLVKGCLLKKSPTKFGKFAQKVGGGLASIQIW